MPALFGDNVKIRLLREGAAAPGSYRAGAEEGRFSPFEEPAGGGGRRRPFACCEDCGYTWRAAGRSSYLPVLLAALLLLLFLPGILAGVNAFLAHFDPPHSGSRRVSSPQEADSVWAQAYTPLEDFDFYVDGETLHLTRCKSREDKIYIAPSYDYNGRTLPVVSLEGGMFFPSVDSIILSEGIESVDLAVFNSCGVKNVYFPSTVKDFDGWSYFHHGEILYYGGDEAMWSEIFPYERRELDFVEIVCSASVSDLLGLGQSPDR